MVLVIHVSGYFLSCWRRFSDLRLFPHSSHLHSFVVISLLGTEARTPVCKCNLDPIYDPRDVTFEFPIFMLLVDGLDGLVET